MRKWIVLTAAAVLMTVLYSSCSKRNDLVKKETSIAGNYRFNYSPYGGISVQDRQLYNYIFNIVRNKLVYYVQKTLVSVPEPAGMVLELDSGNRLQFEDAMKCKVRRGWSVFDTDVIPLPDEDVANYNSGSMDQRSVQTPKAFFYVSGSGNTATVYVKYWILQYYNYNFIHYLAKTSNWSVIGTDVLN